MMKRMQIVVSERETPNMVSDKKLHARRAVLQGGALIALELTCGPAARAAAPAQNGNCLTILYPGGEGRAFNADYYRDHHLSLIKKLYGDTIQRVELRTIQTAPATEAADPNAPPPGPPFAAATNIWINDAKAFHALNQKHGEALHKDAASFTNARPVIQFDKVHGESGAKRSAPAVGDSCLTILYPNSAGVRWDVDYYRTHHMPLIMRLYGLKAISRFELRRGESGIAGGPPQYIGAVNIYIQDPQAFAQAGKLHNATLVKDVPNFSSVMPNAYPSQIHALA
jgi:uncharacterized protein (TIGR02118 family)